MKQEHLYNEDELHAPDWMNTEFFGKVLRNVFKENVKIVDYVITPGTTKSDHYASIMFRAKINYISNEKLQTQSVIIKANPVADGPKKDTLGEIDVFETEIKMYTETLPKIEKILREYGDETKLCARIFYYEFHPHKCIAFEDLVERGYSVISNRYCTMDEVKAALLKLAKMHAVSFKLGKEGDKAITSHDKGSFTSTNVNHFAFIRNALKVFKEVIAEQKDLCEFVPHVENVEKDILNKCIESFSSGTSSSDDRNNIFVLNHGDFHMKNIMIKNDAVAKTLQDLIMVDYQISIYGSAAIDLHYAFVMLFSPEMRRQHHEELIYYYIRNFQDTLKLIQYDGHIPTILEFQMELSKHKHWGLYLVMSFLMFSYVFSQSDGDLAKTIEDESYRRQVLENPKLQQELRLLLPRLLHMGYFEN